LDFGLYDSRVNGAVEGLLQDSKDLVWAIATADGSNFQTGLFKAWEVLLLRNRVCFKW
jgi:hypothetical protein